LASEFENRFENFIQTIFSESDSFVDKENMSFGNKSIKNERQNNF